MDERDRAMQDIVDRRTLERAREARDWEAGVREESRKAEAIEQRKKDQRRIEMAAREENFIENPQELVSRLQTDFPKEAKDPEFLDRVVIEASGTGDPTDYRTFKAAGDRVLEAAKGDPVVAENHFKRERVGFNRTVEVAQEILEGRKLEGSLPPETIRTAFKRHFGDDRRLMDRVAERVDELGAKGADMSQWETYQDAAFDVRRRDSVKEMQERRR